MKVNDKLLKDISGELDVGMVVYLHRDTLEVLSTLDFVNNYDAQDYIEDFKETLDKIESDRDKYIKLEKMSSREGYQVMASFVESEVEDPKMQGRLEQSIEGHRPFANFKHALDHDMDVRAQWFVHKEKCYMDYVARLLEIEEV